jgi:hypothetical protein
MVESSKSHAQQSVHLTLGSLRHPKHFLRCRVFSTPKPDCANTPAQVTQAVGWQRRRASAKPYLFRKLRFNNWLKNSVLFLAVAFFK